MADISKITLPNGTSYDFKDSVARNGLAGKAASSHTHSEYVNQNAFSNITVGSTTVSADSATDTLTLVAGSNITITPDATNDKVTIASTNTWRGIQNNLTSDSTTDSLSAAQGKVLKGLVDGKAASSHTHSAYAAKSKYGDTTINVGRLSGSTVGDCSTAEGYNTTASGNYSHAEGYSTTASGEYSHAEGSGTASGNYSHAEGGGTTASGITSHAEGYFTTASGDYSHAGGCYTQAYHTYEVAYGTCNKSNNNTLFSIGDGTATARHNAFEITSTGGKLHDKDIAVKDDLPTSLPANGGNADTVDGLHANGFIKVNSSNAYDCNTLYDAGLYLCNGSATNTPNDLTYGSLFVMPYRKPYGNPYPDYCAQIFIPNGDASDTSMWYRTSLQTTWDKWKRLCDGDNIVKPYVTGTLGEQASNSNVTLGFEIFNFTPSKVICQFGSGSAFFADVITNGFYLTIPAGTTTIHYIAFK